jgi:hypothetical protein
MRNAPEVVREVGVNDFRCAIIKTSTNAPRPLFNMTSLSRTGF